jgi:hypothetical protein
MSALLEDLVRGRVLPHPLHPDDRRSLLRLAHGNPGRLTTSIELLGEPRFWQGDRTLTAAVHGETLSSVLNHYLAGPGTVR